MASVLQAPMSGAINQRPQVANHGQSLPTAANKALSTRLAKLDLEDIATVIGKDDTTACKVRSNERPCTVSQFCALLELAGLKLVSQDKQCVPADELQMLRRCYARLHGIDLWNDPE
jgi:hypothetical protein